jgi:hypothetical protein
MSIKDDGIWESSLEERPDFVHAIGMISIEHGNLELSLADLLARTIGLSKKVAHAIYFTPRAGVLRVEILQSAAQMKFAPGSKDADHPLEKQKAAALQKIERLTKRAIAVMQRRNQVMHDAWGISRNGKEEPVLRGSGRDILRDDSREVPIQELKDIIRDLRRVITDVDNLAEEFRTRPPFMSDMRESATKSGSSARMVSSVKPASHKK